MRNRAGGPDATVLDARARALAKAPDGPAGESAAVLCFRVGSDTYAMEYARLGEVSPLSGITPLPGVPPFVLGILNRRGSILAILSLRSLLGIPEPDGTAESSVITLHGPETEFGLAVDEIVGIVSIPAADLLSPSPALTGPGSQYFKASTATGLVLLDVGLLLNDKRLQVREAEGDAP